MALVNRRAFLAAMGGGGWLAAQDEEPVAMATDHPRLFLRPARQRLLRRERERATARWRQFEALVAGKAPLPEPGFALALYYQVSGNEDAARQAVAWALADGADLRQAALVFDWCQGVAGDAATRELAARLEKGIAASAGDAGIAAARSRVLAATALYDHVEGLPQRELERTVRVWWRSTIVGGLAKGSSVIAREEAYPLYELLHVLRDNTLLDLRESRPDFFQKFPIEHLLGYYPAPFQGQENAFYIGATRKTGDPDLRDAALSRAAELAMVAYDTNAAETQLLQGWLMRDPLMLAGPFGAPYEFLWANPYQPGLSYDHAPLCLHDADQGRLFARSSWDETAAWFGCFEGVFQMFGAGRVSMLNPRLARPAMSLGPAVVCVGSGSPRFRITVTEGQQVFLAGLEPHRTFQVEVDDQEMFEASADAGGIVELSLPCVKDTGLRVHPVSR